MTKYHSLNNSKPNIQRKKINSSSLEKMRRFGENNKNTMEIHRIKNFIFKPFSKKNLQKLNFKTEPKAEEKSIKSCFINQINLDKDDKSSLYFAKSSIYSFRQSPTISLSYTINNNDRYKKEMLIEDLCSEIKEIEELEKEKELINVRNKELTQNINNIQKKYDDLTKENDKLINKKNDLIQQVNDLNDLVDLSNKDLVAKILELKKVIDVLHKQIELEMNKKNELENKLLKLQQKLNKQIDEASEREEASINTISKISKENNINNNNNINENENIPFTINTEIIDNYKNQVLSLKNENNSLMKTINNLKDEIKTYKSKMRRPSSKNLDKKMMENIKDINDEDLIKDITEEMNKWKQEYYKLSKINELLKDNITKLEKNLGVEEEIRYLKEALAKKDELLMDLTLQIKEYQSKSDDIILGRTNKSKDKQIEILLNEVKGIRKRLLNIVTLNERITDYEDFMNNIKIIQGLENKSKDKNVKKAFEQLNMLIEEYKLNNEMAYNDFLVKLFMIE